ncbi:MAG: hypothetical protein GY926_22250 [bacterium]|nr:hypothetical protein [bacterium]
MAKNLVLVSFSIAALSLLNACQSGFCTLVAGVPGVVVDTADLRIGDPDEVEVCVNNRCLPLYEIEEPSLGHGESETVIRIEGDARERTIVIRERSGQILAGPAVIDLELFEPNGEGCPGSALQGHFRVSADGVIS